MNSPPAAILEELVCVTEQNNLFHSLWVSADRPVISLLT